MRCCDQRGRAQRLVCQVPFACPLEPAGRGTAAAAACRVPAERGPVVSGNVELLVSRQQVKKRRGAYQITLTDSQSRDWARLWPSADEVSPVFRLLMLPIRLLSLALLWATSTPARLLLGIALGAVVALALIIR